jgi:predicted N-formylglutamate amidohydrolase
MRFSPSRSDNDFGPAVAVSNPGGRAPIVLVCEHASRTIPPALDGLGLGPVAAQSHVAWDIGALDLARGLSERLDAPLVAGRLSRLVYDCNRPPEAHDAIPARSEVFEIPGNQDLPQAERARRTALVYEPFHDALATLLAARTRPTVLVTVHSFTPVYNGTPRDVELGLLHGDDDRLARSMLVHTGQTGWLCALNAPYGPQDGVLHTLDRHAAPQGMLNVMIELRNDLIRDQQGVGAAAVRLSALLGTALADLGVTEQGSA